MRKIQINKIYCVQTPTSKKLVVCKRHENFDDEKSWEDVEVRDITSKNEDEIFLMKTQLGVPHLDDPIVVKDTQGNEYSFEYRNNQLTKRSLYELFSKFLEKPLTLDEFNKKTKGKIQLDNF